MGQQPAVEQLRELLRQLKPGARALLIAELERSILNGGNTPGSELILAELRRDARDGDAEKPRTDEHVRLFVRTLEPFLVDDVPDHKHRGRVARAILDAIWQWISSALMPGQTKVYAEAIADAVQAGDADGINTFVTAFQDEVAERLQATLEKFVEDDKAQRKLAVRLGTPRLTEDLQNVIGVLRARDTLAQLGSLLPVHIKTLAGPSLDSVKSQIDATVATQPDVLLYALVLTMHRLAAPWQLVRLAVKAARSDGAVRVANTPYEAAVTLVMAEVERLIREFTEGLKSGRAIAISVTLKDVHDALRGLRTELDLPPDSSWGRQLAAMRADIAKLLSAEIERLPSRVRALLRARAVNEIAPNSTIDADEVDQVEPLIGLVAALRTYSSELAVSELTKRTFNDIQQFLDTGTRALLESLRASGDRERPFRHSQVEAAVRFCGRAFGPDYAALLGKAANVAAHDHERKLVRA